MELVCDAAAREPADAETKQVARFCYGNGLHYYHGRNVQQRHPDSGSVGCQDEQFDEGLGVIEAALAAVADASRPRSHTPRNLCGSIEVDQSWFLLDGQWGRGEPIEISRPAAPAASASRTVHVADAEAAIRAATRAFEVTRRMGGYERQRILPQSRRN